MPASPVTSRPLTRPSAPASGTTGGRRPSVSNRQYVSSSGMLRPSRQPKDSPSPTSLRNTIRRRSNSETKATSMPSPSLSASSARPRVSGTRSDATSESLASFAVSPAWSSRKTYPLSRASVVAHPQPRRGSPTDRGLLRGARTFCGSAIYDLATRRSELLSFAWKPRTTRKPSLALYSPNLVEGAFPAVRIREPAQPAPTPVGCTFCVVRHIRPCYARLSSFRVMRRPLPCVMLSCIRVPRGRRDGARDGDEGRTAGEAPLARGRAGTALGGRARRAGRAVPALHRGRRGGLLQPRAARLRAVPDPRGAREGVPHHPGGQGGNPRPDRRRHGVVGAEVRGPAGRLRARPSLRAERAGLHGARRAGPRHPRQDRGGVEDDGPAGRAARPEQRGHGGDSPQGGHLAPGRPGAAAARGRGGGGPRRGLQAAGRLHPRGARRHDRGRAGGRHPRLRATSGGGGRGGEAAAHPREGPGGPATRCGAGALVRLPDRACPPSARKARLLGFPRNTRAGCIASNIWDKCPKPAPSPSAASLLRSYLRKGPIGTDRRGFEARPRIVWAPFKGGRSQWRNRLPHQEEGRFSFWANKKGGKSSKERPTARGVLSTFWWWCWPSACPRRAAAGRRRW